MSDYRFTSIKHGPRYPHSPGYQEELTQLRSMGFLNHTNNIKALKKANGNVNVAVDILFTWPGNDVDHVQGHGQGDAQSRPHQQPHPQPQPFQPRPPRPTIHGPIILDSKAPQMRELKSMGFTNESMNVAALEKAGGAIEGAINFLVEHPEEVERYMRDGGKDRRGDAGGAAGAGTTTGDALDRLGEVGFTSGSYAAPQRSKSKQKDLLIDFGPDDDDDDQPLSQTNPSLYPTHSQQQPQPPPAQGQPSFHPAGPGYAIPSQGQTQNSMYSTTTGTTFSSNTSSPYPSTIMTSVNSPSGWSHSSTGTSQTGQHRAPENPFLVPGEGQPGSTNTSAFSPAQNPYPTYPQPENPFI